MASPRSSSINSFSTKVDPQIVDMDLNKGATHVVTASRSNLRILSIEKSSFRDKQTIRVGKKSGLNFSLTGVAWKGSDENVIASGSTSGAVIVWNLALSTYSKQERMFTYHNRTCNSVAFHPNESLFLSGSQDGTCILYDTRKPDLPPSTFTCEEAVRHVQFFPTHSHYFSFIACVENGSVKVFDIRRPDHYERSLTCHNGPVFCSGFHPSLPDRLATAGRDRTIKVWDLSPSSPQAFSDNSYANPRASALSTTASIANAPLLAHSITSIAPVSSISWRSHSPNQIACTSLSETRVCVFDVRRPCIPYATFEHYGDEQPIRAMWRGDNEPDSLISCGRDGTVFHHSMHDASFPADFASPQALAIDHAHEQVLFSCSRQLLFDAPVHASGAHNAKHRNSLAAAADLLNSAVTSFTDNDISPVVLTAAAASSLALAASLPGLTHQGESVSTGGATSVMYSNASSVEDNVMNDMPMTIESEAVKTLPYAEKAVVLSNNVAPPLYEASFKSELLVLSERALMARVYAALNSTKHAGEATKTFSNNESKMPNNPILPHSLSIRLTAQLISLPTYAQSASMANNANGSSASPCCYANVKDMCEHNALLALALSKDVEAQTWRMLAVMLLTRANGQHRQQPNVVKHYNKSSVARKSSVQRESSISSASRNFATTSSNGDHHHVLDRNHSISENRRTSIQKAHSAASTTANAGSALLRHSRNTTATATTATVTDSEHETGDDDSDQQHPTFMKNGVRGNRLSMVSRKKPASSSTHNIFGPPNTPPLNDVPMGAGELLFGEQTVPEDFDLAFLSSAATEGPEGNLNMPFTNHYYNNSATSGMKTTPIALPADAFSTQHDLKLATLSMRTTAAASNAPKVTASAKPKAASSTLRRDDAIELVGNHADGNTSVFHPNNYRDSVRNGDAVIHNGTAVVTDDEDEDAASAPHYSSTLLRTNFEPLSTNLHISLSKSNGTLPCHALLFDYDAVIAELVRFCIDQSDLQLACHIIIMLGNQHVRVLPDVTEQLMSCWFTDYITLLRRLRCFSAANRITKLCPVESVRTSNCVSTSIHVCCGQCGATMPSNNNNSTGGVGPSPHRCAKCRHKSGLCALCHLPVRGAMIWCQGCSHGGHWAHMLQWFRGGDGELKEKVAAPVVVTSRRECPAGCGHMCEYAFRL